MDPNQSLLKSLLIDSAVSAHVLELAVIKRAIIDSQKPPVETNGKRRPD